MRIIPFHEKKQRGCLYCLHVKSKKFGFGGGDSHTACPFDECPFHVLDKYKSYEEYMKSEDSRIPVSQFFSTAANAYTMATVQTAKRVFTDGDSRVNL